MSLSLPPNHTLLGPHHEAVSETTTTYVVAPEPTTTKPLLNPLPLWIPAAEPSQIQAASAKIFFSMSVVTPRPTSTTTTTTTKFAPPQPTPSSPPLDPKQRVSVIGKGIEKKRESSPLPYIVAREGELTLRGITPRGLSHAVGADLDRVDEGGKVSHWHR